MAEQALFIGLTPEQKKTAQDSSDPSPLDGHGQPDRDPI